MPISSKWGLACRHLLKHSTRERLSRRVRNWPLPRCRRSMGGSFLVVVAEQPPLFSTIQQLPVNLFLYSGEYPSGGLESRYGRREETAGKAARERAHGADHDRSLFRGGL